MTKPTSKPPHALFKVGVYSFVSVILGVILGVAFLVLWALSIWLWGLGIAYQIGLVILWLLLASLGLALVGGALQFRRDRAEFRKEYSE